VTDSDSVTVSYCQHRVPQTQTLPQHCDCDTVTVTVSVSSCKAHIPIIVTRRNVMYDSSRRENYVEYLASIGRHGEAATELAICVNDDAFVSPSGKSKHQLWQPGSRLYFSERFN